MSWLRSGPAASYEVSCACGAPVRGQRRAEHQVVRCPICNRTVFVLPVGSAGRAGTNNRRKGKHRRRSGWKAWAAPALAGAMALTALVVAFVALLPHISRPPASTVTEPDAAEARQQIEAGRDAMAEGNFNRALKEFEAAEAMRDRLSGTEGRQLKQLIRQANLLAALLGKSVQEIVREAAHVRSEDEWRARFRQEYAGKAVLFDDPGVRRNAAGRPALTYYDVRADGELVRLALEELKVFEGMPLNPPQRLLFGARLAGVAREPGGGWVIHFEPDSGVLLTDEKAVASSCPAPIDDGMRGLLQRQAEMTR